MSVSASSEGNTIFDAEGLPDKFSIERHDMTSMTIGTQCRPNRTTIPARSALHPLGEVGPNQDEVLEEEERAIASMALYIASAHEPSSMVSLGQGAHGGVCPVHWGHEAHPLVLGIRGLVQHPIYPEAFLPYTFFVP